MNIKVAVSNRKARFEYEIIQTFEVGLVLQGTEVKSIREGHANIGESFCRISESMDAWLINAHISEYKFGNINNHDPLRERKLLLHKHEIRRLYGKLKEKGLTLVPLKLYFKQGRVKVEVALVKGKKLHDKREAMKREDAEREVQKTLKSKNYEG